MPILREDRDLKEALTSCKNICVVGISPDPYKPSYFVSDVLQSRGFKLFLVNPNYAGRTILGEKVYASLDDVPENVLALPLRGRRFQDEIGGLFPLLNEPTQGVLRRLPRFRHFLAGKGNGERPVIGQLVFGAGVGMAGKGDALCLGCMLHRR